jgi:hypothetical protein
MAPVKLTSEPVWCILTMMKATLDLEKPALELEALQNRQHISAAGNASCLLAEAVVPAAAEASRNPELHWTSAPMFAKVNLADPDAVAWAMDLP